MLSAFASGVIILTVVANCQCQGITYSISGIETTGASKKTASQDGLKYHGVAASEQMASTDAKKIKKHNNKIMQVANELSVDPALIEGIMSRESRGGSALGKDGFGKYDKNGFGLMQIDKRHHKIRSKDPTSTDHIRQGIEILRDTTEQVRKMHPDWTDAQVRKAGISAYNFGAKNVKTIEGMDKGTTNNDYANDVVARTGQFKKMKNDRQRRDDL